MDLIRRQAAIDAHCELCDMNDKCICIYCKDIDMFESLPTAGKKGKWIPNNVVNAVCPWCCSECNSNQTNRTPYCQMCGARMEE